jgi:hypothetical protein
MPKKKTTATDSGDQNSRRLGNGQEAVGEQSRSGRWEPKKATDGQPKRCERGRRDEEDGVTMYRQTRRQFTTESH